MNSQNFATHPFAMSQPGQYNRVFVQPLSRIPSIEPGDGSFEDLIRVFLHLSLVAAVGVIASHLLTFLFSLVSPILNLVILFVATNLFTTPQIINTDIVLPISVIIEVATSFSPPSSAIISCILYSFYAQIFIMIALFLLDIKFEVIPSFVFVCLLQSVTPSRSLFLRCFMQVFAALIGVTVGRMIEQMISLTNPETCDGRLIAWKKRRSSSSSSSSSVKIRRTSLPLLLGSRSHSIGNPVSVPPFPLSLSTQSFIPFRSTLSPIPLHCIVTGQNESSLFSFSRTERNRSKQCALCTMQGHITCRILLRSIVIPSFPPSFLFVIY